MEEACSLQQQLTLEQRTAAGLRERIEILEQQQREHVALIDQLTQQISKREKPGHLQQHFNLQSRDEIIARYDVISSIANRRLDHALIRHLFSTWKGRCILQRSIIAFKAASVRAHAALRANCSAFFFSRLCSRRTVFTALMIWRVQATKTSCRRTLCNRTIDVTCFSRRIRLFKVKSHIPPLPSLSSPTSHSFI